MPAVAVDHLTKRFGATVAVDDLSFSVEAGTVVGFLGPNGAGKTTTLRALLGLVAPDAGTATIEGRRFAELPDPAHTVGAMLEGGLQHPGRRGRDHLRALARAAGVPRARVEELLELVDLGGAAHRRAGGYSLAVTPEASGAIVVHDRSGEDVGRAVAAGAFVISELVPLGSSLEEIFFELTRDEDPS
jgi:ABC-2 type transport system ATP-binding protein